MAKLRLFLLKLAALTIDKLRQAKRGQVAKRRRAAREKEQEEIQAFIRDYVRGPDH
jgi:hypothetical protein